MNPLFEKLEKMGLKTHGDPNERLPITRADVESLETFFGFPFPPLYAEFLQHFSWSYVLEGHATFKVPEDWDARTEGAYNGVVEFIGIDPQQESNGWGIRAWINEARKEGLPPHLFMIHQGDGPNNVMIYLSCREQDYGHVYAWSSYLIWADMEGGITQEKVNELAFHLADSFEGFLEGLEVVPPESLSNPQEIDPLFAAMHAGDVAYLQRIVDAGEIATYRSQFDLTLLQCAVVTQLDWPVEFLLKRGAPIQGALWVAMANDVVGAARLLIAHGVDVNQPYFTSRDSTGYWTIPIISTVRSYQYDKKYDMARFLISAGADATLPDSDGKTAWDYVHPRNQVMRDILQKSVPVPPEQRAKYSFPIEPKAP